jgi:hypothetical protein
MLLYPNPPRPHKPAVDNAGGAAISNLPNNWDRMLVGALWDALNHPSRFATPQSTIDAILCCVRTRGIAALEEPNIIERLSRCDEAAMKQIRERIERMREKDLLP